MENLLLMGIDTRPMVNSALKLDYKTFSISYFKTVDFKVPYAEKHVLDQESVISCGRFEENYSPDKLLLFTSGYKSLFSKSVTFNNQAWWLIPAISHLHLSIKSFIFSDSNNPWTQHCTEWQRPTVLGHRYFWI